MIPAPHPAGREGGAHNPARSLARSGQREEIEAGAGRSAGQVEAEEGVGEGDGDTRHDALVDLGLASADEAAQLLGAVARLIARAPRADGHARGQGSGRVGAAPATFILLPTLARSPILALSSQCGARAWVGEGGMEDTVDGDAPLARRVPVVGRFVLVGVVFGALFPLGAWTLDLYLAHAAWTLGQVIRAHRATPVLWIVDLAPLVLGLAGAIIGVQHGRLRRLYAQAERRATHDPLTALPNRALLHDRLAEATRHTRRTGSPLALLLLDLDRFKEVNDTLGHAAGDRLLVEVAARLRGVARPSDTVARLGGDEFAVLLPAADAARVDAVVAVLRPALEEPVVLDGHTLSVGASIGSARCPDHGVDGATLLRHADVAMYVAKRGGLGHTAYDPALDAHDATRLALVADLRQVLDRGGLTVQYQPQVDAHTGRVAGVEALVRWPHPAHGLIPPDHFIPLAEQTGLIVPLTAQVLDAALRQCRAWERAGLALRVAVNISLRTLRDPHLSATVEGALRRHGVPAARLCLELTESVVMTDVEGTRATLARLAGLGVRLAIDDFGTGYSSLSYLSRLPVHELKIDRSFVRHLVNQPADATIVASTIGLGHALGLDVVTEGVEDARTWEALRRMGCDVGQGYYFARPLPADDLTRWLASQGVARASA